MNGEHRACLVSSAHFASLIFRKLLATHLVLPHFHSANVSNLADVNVCRCVSANSNTILQSKSNFHRCHRIALLAFYEFNSILPSFPMSAQFLRAHVLFNSVGSLRRTHIALPFLFSSLNGIK